MELDATRTHILRSTDREAQRAFVRALLDQFVRIKTKSVIAIKPNLCAPLPSQTGATTELWLIEEVARWIRERRGKPVLVEAPSHIHDYDQVMEVTGVRDLCKALDIEMVDSRVHTMALRPLKHDDAGGRVYHVGMAALGADGIICLPKLKTHNRTEVTLGMKGLMGLLSWPDRHEFHRRGVSKDVVELYRRLKSRIKLTIVDGITAMEGHGPTNGKPVAMNVLVGGTDLVGVDAVCAQIMGFEPEDIDHIRLAHDQGLGDMKQRWVVHPEGTPLPVRPFERPRPDSGLRTQIITFPPLSAALRAVRFGVSGRTKPVLNPAVPDAVLTAEAAVCPTNAIELPNRIVYERCIGCGLCIEASTAKALIPESTGHKATRVLLELIKR